LSCTDDLDTEGRYAELAEALHPGVRRCGTDSPCGGSVR
jgi:hypothetical protein